MDQSKIGNYLKDLRKEKDLTQEQLAEKLSVSRRTISRWETGNNLPDLDLLIELADFYDVDLRDLIDGERTSKAVDKDLKETVLKVADYSNEEKEKLNKTLNILFIVGTILFIAYFYLEGTDLKDSFITGFCKGFTLGVLVLGIIMTSRFALKIREMKQRLLQKLEK